MAILVNLVKKDEALLGRFKIGSRSIGAIRQHFFKTKTTHDDNDDPIYIKSPFGICINS